MRLMLRFVAFFNFPMLGAACPKTTGIAVFAGSPTRSSTPGIPWEKFSLFLSSTKAGNRFLGSAICKQPTAGALHADRRETNPPGWRWSGFSLTARLAYIQ